MSINAHYVRFRTSKQKDATGMESIRCPFSLSWLKRHPAGEQWRNAVSDSAKYLTQKLVSVTRWRTECN